MFGMCIWGSHLHLYFGSNAHLFWRIYAFVGSHLHLHFGYNAYILDEMCSWRITFVFAFWLQCTHFGGHVHLAIL